MASRGIEITSRRGVQLVALLFGAAAVTSGCFIFTTGYGTPFFHCAQPLEPPLAQILGVARGLIGVGIVVAALRDLRGPRAADPLLVCFILLLVGTVALGSSTSTLVTGVAWWGRRGCVEIGPPLSYGLALVGFVVATVALYAAMVLFANGTFAETEE